jgi:GT2 family glycosyltransferase
MRGRVSVLLPYRDVAETIEEALESVLAEAIVDEVIAVDHASTDGGARIVERIARRDARVRLLASTSDSLAATLAEAHAAATGELLARMDGDDVSFPGRIARAVERLEADASLGAVGTQVRVLGAAGGGLDRYVAWQNGVLSPHDHRRDRFVESPLCHPSVVLRRSALEAVGGYRDTPWPQDYDLFLRLAQAGFGLAKVPEVLFGWRHREGRATFTSSRNAAPRFVEARAAYLSDVVPRSGRPLVLWGAGKTGKRLARALEPHGVHPSAFIDIDPRKIGSVARGRPILPASALDPSAFVVVAVGDRGARDIVRARLVAQTRVELEDFVCAA